MGPRVPLRWVSLNYSHPDLEGVYDGPSGRGSEFLRKRLLPLRPLPPPSGSDLTADVVDDGVVGESDRTDEWRGVPWPGKDGRHQ